MVFELLGKVDPDDAVMFSSVATSARYLIAPSAASALRRALMVSSGSLSGGSTRSSASPRRLLRCEHDEGTRAHLVLDCTDRPFASDEKRHHHVRKSHEVARQHRIAWGLARHKRRRDIAVVMVPGPWCYP